MNKIVNILYCIFFILIIGIPLVSINTKKNVVSDIDNRALAELPTFGEEGFTNNFEEYLADRIGGRNWMINAYAVLNDRIAGELTHPTYTYGKNGYVFFHMPNNIEYDDFHKTFAEMVWKIQTYCEERGTKFYFIFDPEKISVYRR